MSVERIKELYSDYKKALERLQEAVAEDLSKGSIVLDGTIQRFEFTFELSWKLAKVILNYNGVDVETPRAIIKEAFQKKMIEDGNGWVDMLEDRNKTSHIYDEQEALDIYTKIKENHVHLLEEFCSSVMNFVKE